jgi:hypothetical protein
MYDKYFFSKKAIHLKKTFAPTSFIQIFCSLYGSLLCNAAKQF